MTRQMSLGEQTVLRQAVIVPGSSKWWLLTLSPIIYFDRVRVSADDLVEIHNQSGQSAYHEAVSGVLRAIEKHADEEIFVVDESLPQKGESPHIASEVTRLSNALLDMADAYSSWHPTVVRPGEIKQVLIHACREWRRYNRQKAYSLPRTDPLRIELLERQIPASLDREATYRSVPAARFPEFLRKNPRFLLIFQNIIRNAWLLSSISGSQHERVYDVLAREFLPAVSLTERYRVFVELPEAQPDIHNLETLVSFYNFRMRRLAEASSGKRPPAHEVLRTALSERKRFAGLRKRLAEIDVFVKEHFIPEEKMIREVLALARDLHAQIQRIDRVGKYCIWASGAYVLREMLSTADPIVSRIVGSILVNPLTTEMARDTVKDLYLAGRGVRGLSLIHI